MKRSNEPVFWSLFGAGGMLAALIGAALVFVTGVGVPLRLGLPAETMSYAHALAFARSLAGKAFLFVVISLFLWHAAHRIAILCHDLGMHAMAMVRFACYGSAFIGSAFAAYTLLRISM